MRMARILLALSVVAVLIAACEPDEPDRQGPDVGPITPAATTPAVVQETPLSACPNHQDVVLNEGARVDAQEADMDGDGDEETVSIAKDELGIAGCKGFLVVDHGDSVASVPVEDTLEFDPSLPDIVGFAAIDPFTGGDAIVRVGQGASTGFVAVFSLGSGALVKVPFVEGPRSDGVFPYGGSVGHLDGVDCFEDGVVASSALPEDDGYRIRRSFYVRDGGAMAFDEAATEETVVAIEDLESLPEFSGEPFDECEV